MLRPIVFREKRFKRIKQICLVAGNPVSFLSFAFVMRKANRIGTAPPFMLSNLKYAGAYLNDRLRPTERRRAIMFHHSTIAKHIEPNVWKTRQLAWVDGADEQYIGVELRPSLLAPMEGEHELAFFLGERALCTLTFILMPDSRPGTFMMYIGGIQGAFNAREATRIAAKANGEIAPATMVLIAAKALSQALGATKLVGVPALHHPSRRYAHRTMTFDYDQVWLDAGAVMTGDGRFEMTPELHHRPASEASKKHRSRARQRRERKTRIYADMLATFHSWLKPALRPAA